MRNLLIDLLGRRDDSLDWRGNRPPLDLGAVESVCILHHNHKAGDAILLSLMVDALARARPGLRILVGSSASFAPYWRTHPDVAEVIAFDAGNRRSGPARLLHELRAARRWRDRLDVVLSFHSFARVEHFALLRALRPRTIVGFNKDAYRLFDYSLEEHRYGVDLAPVAAKATSVMRLFGRDTDLGDLRPHLPYGPEETREAEAALSVLSPKGPRILLNAYGSGREKLLTPPTIREMVLALRRASPEGSILVSVPSGLEPEYRRALAERPGEPTAVIGPLGGLSALCALVAAVDAVVSPDTAVGHIAAAMGKAQICLFARRGNIPTIWRPLNPRCAVLVTTRANDVNAYDRREFEVATEALMESAAHPLAVHERPPVEGSCARSQEAPSLFAVQWEDRIGRPRPRRAQ